ncbi:Transmembrane 9 superfamily member 2, partial [Ophiophagus hannah]
MKRFLEGEHVSRIHTNPLPATQGTLEVGPNIELFVNRLDSVESVLPYEYDAFDFCKDQTEERPSENLGQVLFGERIASSPYKFTFKKDEECKKVCVKSYDPQNPEDRNKLDFLKKGMQLNYQHHWIIDNMPVTWCYNVEDSLKYCNPGFPVGCYIASDGRIKDFCIMSDEFNKKNTFYLFNHHTDINNLSCKGPPMEIPAEFNSKLDVIYTYSVKFEEDAQEEFGWKLVHGDVFRPPRKGMLLSVFLGQGTQIFIMTPCLPWFSLPSQPRGFDDLCSGALGFAGDPSRLRICSDVQKIVFANFFIMNLILWVKGSSAAIPFGTLVAILAMWFGISVPLTFIGAYFGFKEKPLEHPVRTNQIPRQIPEQSFFTKPLPGIIMGGILPFGCIFIQLFFILNSICLYHSPDYLFGGHRPALLLPLDYHWWWRSFLTSSFTAVYLFIYAIHYFFSKLQITGIASTILYFGYTMIMVLIFFLFTGTIGFFACFWFVSKIYSVVKVD